ncbi:MAG: NAD(P)H-dependent oxidoreductase subunit E [Dehalococcoidia bacterium]|nr:NAD(P)H-dependent oxidoreductase subunit E [Dehalococcoidia bacterium]
MYSSILTASRRHPGHLIDILQQIQSMDGYLSNQAMLKVAGFLDMSSAAVWGVATFYNQFRFTPPARKPVRVCMGTACHLAGGQLVLEAMARELKIEVGGTSEDREFSLERVACIGCCALAPVVTMKDKVYPRMTPPGVEEVLVGIKAESEAEA